MRQHLPQTGLAAALETSQSRTSKMEQGDATISLDLLLQALSVGQEMERHGGSGLNVTEYSAPQCWPDHPADMDSPASGGVSLGTEPTALLNVAP